MKTLLATDGSTYATAALTSAGYLLTHADNKFDVICVVPDFSFPRLTARSPGLKKWYRSQYFDEMKRKTDKVLTEARQTLQTGGVQAHAFSETGSPADVLVKLANDYDAIVVGAHSASERLSPGLGPVASRVVEHVSGIVLVGRGLLNERNFRVLIGLDGSASSENAVDAFTTSFQSRGADVTLMHVVEKPWLRLGLEEEWYADFERSYGRQPSELPEGEKLFGKELLSEAEDIVENARERLSSRCSSVETRIVEGNPANELLRQSEIGEYDLAVIGATGASDLKHIMLGSVSFKLASYAPCSVAVIR
jgi:nucleotide-binding universal stress UspA family protein